MLGIEAGNRYALAGWSTRSTPRWRWRWGWWELVGRVLVVDLAQLGEGASRICVDVDLLVVQQQHTEATRPGVAAEWKAGILVGGSGFNLPSWLADGGDQLSA
jgi:hypothetical protein